MIWKELIRRKTKQADDKPFRIEHYFNMQDKSHISI